MQYFNENLDKQFQDYIVIDGWVTSSEIAQSDGDSDAR